MNSPLDTKKQIKITTKSFAVPNRMAKIRMTDKTKCCVGYQVKGIFLQQLVRV